MTFEYIIDDSESKMSELSFLPIKLSSKLTRLGKILIRISKKPYYSLEPRFY